MPCYSTAEEEYHCGLHLYDLFSTGGYLCGMNCILLLTRYTKAQWFFGQDLLIAAAGFLPMSNGSIKFNTVHNIPHYLYQR